MSKFTIFSFIGWLLALVAICASLALLWMLRETRAEHRLDTVQLTSRPATRLSEDWTTEKYRVLLVGDSRIRRWEVLPQSAGIAFAKSGIGGETVGQLEARFKRDVLDVKPAPDEIIIAAGINDLVAASVQRKYVPAIHDAISQLVLERLQRMADLARARGIKVRIATIIQPASPDLVRRIMFWDDSLYQLVSAANTQIGTLGHEVIDFNAILEGGDGPMPDQFSLDTLHFNTTAYDTLNEALIEEFGSR